MKALIDMLPPQAIDAERHVLGAMLIDSTVIDAVSEVMQPCDLWRSEHQVIATAIYTLHRERKAVDSVTVHEELRRLGQLELSGGWETLGELSREVNHSLNAVYHAAIVREKSTSRQMITLANDILRVSYDGNVTGDEQIELATKGILQVADSRKGSGLTTMLCAIDGELDRIKQRGTGHIVGISTGFHELDNLTDGFLPTNLIVIAARPGRGKSSLALNMAERAALDFDRAVLFVSQEMGDGEIAGRSLSSRAKVEHQKLRTGNLTQNEMDRLIEARNAAQEQGRFWIDDQGGRTVSQIAASARRLKAQYDLGIIFVDYIQLLESEAGRGSNRQEQVSRISRDLKRLAMDLKLPVVALSQLNRKVEDRDGGKPQLSDLRESGAIENDANIVILLHQPTEDDRVVQALVEKNRNGPTGMVELTFMKQFMRFENHYPDPTPRPGDGF